jgi:c-di-GMP-related signal transduction protein
MDVFVARQPIFNRGLEIYGYELLYRSSPVNMYTGTDETVASLQVLSNCLNTFDIGDVVANGLAFINFTRDLLLNDAAEVLSPKAVVVEVLENVPGDSEVLAACHRLHERGYMIAADDICRADQNQPLLEIADFIKVDFRLASPAEQQKIVAQYVPRGARLLAEKVETQDEFERARQMGFAFFQGYFFARPVVLKGKEIPGFKLNYLRILSEIQSPEIEFNRLELLIRQEVSVAYKLLRYANSALFSQRTRVDSIRRALVILGETEIRKWVSIVLLMHLAVDKPTALAMHSMIRASFCESLAQLSGMGGRKSELFLMGMFSLLDAMIDRPLREALRDIRLSQDIRDTLLSNQPAADPIGSIYHLAQAYERGDWPQVLVYAGQLRLESDEIRGAYFKAVNWCDQVFGTLSNPVSARDREPVNEPVER